MLKNHDPNIYWNIYTVEVILMQWDYSIAIRQEVGGNGKGFDLLESVVDSLFEGTNCQHRCHRSGRSKKENIRKNI